MCSAVLGRRLFFTPLPQILGAKRMVNILRCRDIDYYPQEEWDLGEVLAKRRALMCEEPIISSNITRLDVWLLNHPGLTLEELGQIWVRAMLASSILYQLEKDPDQKHSMLLSLKEDFDEFRKLPEKWQENMRPYWLPWLNVLNVEEAQLGRANGTEQ
jgi:hypothetical protein